MVKVFISQPMKGLTDEEIKEKRNKIIESLKQKYMDIEIIDSYFENIPEVKTIPLFYLGKSIQKLSEADVAYFAQGFEEARGCKIEHICALEYGIKTMIEGVE